MKSQVTMWYDVISQMTISMFTIGLNKIKMQVSMNLYITAANTKNIFLLGII